MDAIRPLVLLLPLLLLNACGDPAPKAPPKPAGAAQVARRLLAAYRARDLPALRALMMTASRPVIDELQAEGEAGPRYTSVFGGWRWKAVTGWNGELRGVRYARRNRAYVSIGKVDDRFLATIELQREDGQWRMNNLTKVTAAHFETMAREPTHDLR